MEVAFRLQRSQELKGINNMKSLIICSSLLSFSISFAGVSIGNMSGNRTVNLDQRGRVEIFKSQVAGDNFKPIFDDSTLTILTGKNANEVKFQTATPRAGQWQIKNWKADELKVNEIPELKNALDKSLMTRNWQKIQSQK